VQAAAPAEQAEQLDAAVQSPDSPLVWPGLSFGQECSLPEFFSLERFGVHCSSTGCSALE
jgi:hypothetical protein